MPKLPKSSIPWLALCLLVGGASCVESDPGDAMRSGRPPAAALPPGHAGPAIEAPPSDRFLTHVSAEPGYLPKWKTQWELAVERSARIAREGGAVAADFYSDYRKKNYKKFFLTKPPTSSVRFPAEYEPSQAYLMTWSKYNSAPWKKLFGEIVKGAWGVVPVLMAYQDAAHKTWIEQEMKAIGIPAADLTDKTKIIWWHKKLNAHWARDYGPVSTLSVPTSGKAKLSFVDFRYYHARHLDDEVPHDLAQEWGINVFRPDLDFEGGNLMVADDACFATKGVLYYNLQYSQSAVEQLFQDYLGCKKSIFPATMKGGVIAHIDMYSKFGSDTHVMVGEYTATQDATNKAVLDANAALFAATTTGSGKAITVTRIPMPNTNGFLGMKVWRTFTNSLSLTDGTNKVVLIPVYSDETSKESAAMAAYAKVFPGWKLVKIDSKIIIPGQGAIHCITMQIPAGERSKMEADPGPLCGAQEYICVKKSCGQVPKEGCCDGETLKYCTGAGSLKATDCASNTSCGWDAAKAMYQCGTAGGADPSGGFKLSCNAQTDAAVPDGGAPDKGPGNCGQITEEGCCDQETVWYCHSGSLNYFSCYKNPKCGWEAQNQYYNCGTAGAADPAGKYLMPCATFFGDAGAPQPESGIPLPCGAVTTKGCCDGDTLKICQNSMLKTLDCGAASKKCGWGSKSYLCGASAGADPSGTYTRQCSQTDSGQPDQARPDLTAPDLKRPDMPPTPDQGAPDGGGDAGDDGGCSCDFDGRGPSPWTGGALPALLLAALFFRRRR